MPISAMFEPLSSSEGPNRDPYRGAVIVLLAAAALGTVGAAVAGLILVNPVLLDTAVSLGLSTGILLGVLITQTIRMMPPKHDEAEPTLAAGESFELSAQTATSSAANRSKALSLPISVAARAWSWFQDRGGAGAVGAITAASGVLAVLILMLSGFPSIPPPPLVAAFAIAACFAAAGIAATAARYLADIDSTRFHEAPYLCQGARVVAWILALAAASIGLAWAHQDTIVQILHFSVLAINAIVSVSLLSLKPPARNENPEIFPLDLRVLSVLGGRANILGSILDAGEQQLGIDLRSTWALTIVRRSMVPLIIGLGLLGWLSTSFTVIGVQDQGLVERLGVAVRGPALAPGLHLHWPWPVDEVFRIPVQRVETQQVGHEGQEEEGPENVLWAVEHAPNEYTLVLGNGRDLITIDAAVQYRIVDPRAWRYNCQNPAAALRAIAYRAVMKSTVNRTLSDALSENIAVLTGQMRDSIQHDADALGLGVQVLAFTVGGMHPPVPVASEYEAVVSAELGKVTAVVNAQAYRNQIVPATEATVLAGDNAVRAQGEQTLALAAGEAWSFRTLESQYHAAPEEFFFRRRLETLEQNLTGLHFTVVDSRFQRDGGELWLTQ
jgi:regulator of protease activity HflC (stomatin/prohibitin superfamily)